MALLTDVGIHAFDDDSKKIDSFVKQVNDNNRLVSNEDRVKIIKDASGTPRLFFGEGPNQFYGMKVSQPGIDVTGADDEDLVFNSDQNVFKIIDSGSIDLTQITIPGSVGNYEDVNTTVATYTHGFGFKPSCLAFMEQTSGVRVQLPYTLQQAFSGSYVTWQTYNATVSNTTFRITLRAVTFGGPVISLAGNIRFYLLQETAE